MIVIGHRGARFEAPENTVAGIGYALSIGIRALEFDIRMSRDGQLVVLHDATVDRTTNGSGSVSDFTLEDLRTLDARSIHESWPEPVQIPTFAEVLDVLTDTDWMEIEIKSDTHERLDEIVPKVIAEMRSRTIAGRPMITSFDVYALELAKQHAPEIERGYIGAYDSMEFLSTAIRLECARACIPYKTGSADIVAGAQDAGMIVTSWPTNSIEEFNTALEWGVDGMCTDQPSTLFSWCKDAGVEWT